MKWLGGWHGPAFISMVISCGVSFLCVHNAGSDELLLLVIARSSSQSAASLFVSKLFSVFSDVCVTLSKLNVDDSSCGCVCVSTFIMSWDRMSVLAATASASTGFVSARSPESVSKNSWIKVQLVVRLQSVAGVAVALAIALAVVWTFAATSGHVYKIVIQFKLAACKPL